MNTFPSPSQAPSNFLLQRPSQSQRRSTALALSRTIPGVMSAASLLQSQQPVPRSRAVVEITIGKDPQSLVSEAVARVRHPGLNVSAPLTAGSQGSGIGDISGRRRFQGRSASTSSTVFAAGISRSTRRSQAYGSTPLAFAVSTKE